MKTETISLKLGALCDPISKQIAGMASAEDLAKLDAMNNAINLCYIHGLVMQNETNKARRRLMKRCEIAMKKHLKLT